MASKRRMGDPESATAQVILDGAERVLQSRGYGAITSRSIAEEAGVKHQLVYYYYQDIDDLLLAAFKRRMARGIERLKQNAKADHPIRAIWDNFNDAIDASLDFEYMALANHHDGVRLEIVRFLTEARAIQTGIIELVYREKNIDPGLIPPGALAFLITYTSMSMTREEGTGFTVAHKEIKGMVERLLQSME
jgi:TetR/AcrR family transcriptional regulator of autoinduction and epiphytic fitness